MTGTVAASNMTRRLPVNGWFYTTLCCLPANRQQALLPEEILLAIRAAGCKGATTRQVLSSLVVLEGSPFVEKVVEVPKPKYALTAEGFKMWKLLRDHCGRWTEKTFRASHTRPDGHTERATFSRDVVKAALVESDQARSVESLAAQTWLSRDSVRRGLKALGKDVTISSGKNSEGNTCQLFTLPPVQEIGLVKLMTPVPIPPEEDEEAVVVKDSSALQFGDGDADSDLDFEMFKSDSDSVTTTVASPAAEATSMVPTSATSVEATPVDVYVEDVTPETVVVPPETVHVETTLTVDVVPEDEAPTPRKRSVVLPPLEVHDDLWSKIVIQANLVGKDPAVYLCDFLSAHLDRHLADIIDKRHKRLQAALQEV